MGTKENLIKSLRNFCVRNCVRGCKNILIVYRRITVLWDISLMLWCTKPGLSTELFLFFSTAEIHFEYSQKNASGGGFILASLS